MEKGHSLLSKTKRFLCFAFDKHNYGARKIEVVLQMLYLKKQSKIQQKKTGYC